MYRYYLPTFLFPLLLSVTSMVVATRAQVKPAAEISIGKCWSYPMSSLASGITSDAAAIYIGSAGAKVEVLSLDGKKLWSSELGGDIGSNMLATDSGVVLATTTSTATGERLSGTLRSLSKETGITNWTLKLPDSEQYFLSSNGGSVVVVAQNGTIQAIDAKTGSVKWKRDIADGFAAEPAFSGDKLVVAAKANQIFTVSLTSGEIESMRRSVYSVTALALLPTGEIAVGDERGNVSTLNGTDKPLWKFKSGGEISHIFASGENILATSHDNFIYYLAARNGDVDWKKRLGGRVLHLANIADKYVVSTSFEENSAAFTDLSTGKVAGQMVFGPDEKLVADPISASGSIMLLTDIAVYSYSLGDCRNAETPVREALTVKSVRSRE